MGDNFNTVKDGFFLGLGLALAYVSYHAVAALFAALVFMIFQA